MPRRLLPALFALLFVVDRAHADDPPGFDFAHDVLPVLADRCARCHTGGKTEGDLSMNTREDLLQAKVVVPGQSGKSPLIERVTSNDDNVRMPPEGKPLSPKQIAALKKWIDAGVPWQPGFSFAERRLVRPLALQRPELPPARDGRTNPVDRIVDAYFAQHDVPRPARVDDALFARRVYLDLVGLLPTPDELQAFLDDERPDKRARLVRELLSRDRQYAEHWLTFWNDLLRNDYAGTGYIDGGRKQITGWLYRSLLQNAPYDRFVRQLIAPEPEAEGFVKGIKWRGRVNASQVPQIQFAQNVGQVFLGANLKCASCHDSFIDDWTLQDAYGLAAVVSERPLEIHRCDKPTGKMARAKFLWPQLGELDPDQPRAKRLQRTAELLTLEENGRLSRTIVNRLWHRLMGRGIVHPVDVMANEPWSPELLEFLAADLVDHGWDLKRTLELICTSEAYAARSVVLEEPPPATGFVFRGPIARRMTAEQFVDAIWRITGTAPGRPDAKVGDRGNEPVRASLVKAGPLMRSLGRPNREQVVSTRPAELTTLQALDLSNGPELAALLRRGAANLRREHPDWNAEQFARFLYRAALCREPTSDEAAVATTVAGSPVTQDGLADLLWIVFLLPEFQLVR